MGAQGFLVVSRLRVAAESIRSVVEAELTALGLQHILTEQGLGAQGLGLRA